MAGYRALFTRSLTWPWLIATATTRFAVCTVPLAVVFMAAEHTGSYAWGAVIAGTYAGGEAIGAPRMGARFQHRPMRTELSWVAVTEAIALAGVVGSLRFGLPLAAVLFAALGGGVASGTFGGLRTLLVQSAPNERESAMALASALFLARGNAAVFLTGLGIVACVVFMLTGWRERGTHGNL